MSSSASGSSRKRRNKNIDESDCPKPSTSKNTEKGYVEGSIVRIKLENILTYDSVEFTTGPFLNVIIGPNGTGKSTIVCAICLGLAGKTNLLGRAQQPQEFIKYGCQKGKIEIALFNPNEDERNWIIEREIHRSNASQWKINGVSSAMKAVEEKMSSLNIQVGNLCQFLPQEKVADFAKMTQEELLENTEKAIGSPELYESHQKLKEARNEGRKLNVNFDNLMERLNQAVLKNSRIEQDVKNFREREQHQQKIIILKKKRPWIEYNNFRKLYDQHRGERDAKIEELKKASSEYEPLSRKLELMAEKKKKADNEVKIAAEKLRDIAKKTQVNSKDIEAAGEKLNEIQEEYEMKQNEENTRLQRIQDLKRQLDALRNELQTFDDNVDVQPQLDKVTQEIRAVSRNMSQMQGKGEEISRERSLISSQIQGYQRELKHYQNIENRKLDLLRNKHKETFDAVMWLKENMNRFSGNVYHPMMLTINPKDPSYAKYIEAHVRFDDMRAFVFENSNDYNLFMQEIRDKQRLRVNAVKVPSAPLESFRPDKDISQYRQYGFYSYLREFITCPDGVMRYLCAQYNVHRIPVGDKKTQQCIHQFRDTHKELTFFYTDEFQYTFKHSRYDGSVSSRSSKIKDASLLTASADQARENELKSQIQELQGNLHEKESAYKELQNESKVLDRHLNTLREEKKKLTQQKEQGKRLQSQIESKQQKIVSEEKAALNLDEERKKMIHKIDQINNQKLNHLFKMKENTKGCTEQSKKKAILSLLHADVTREHEELHQQLSDQTQHLSRLQRDVEEAKNLVKRTKDEAKKKLEEAKKTTDTPLNEELSDEMKRVFEKYPSTIDEIDAAIHEEQARVESIFATDENVIAEYEKRKIEIAKLEFAIAEKKKALDHYQKGVDSAKQNWLEPLRTLIATINKKFSYFFSCLNCAGEVSLKIPENPEDYEKYGVMIKVKFRDVETLKELTPTHQSGGERSVATVLYMMALQELARCPFRCVDEINQGMDPINERKVFELVVQTVCRTHSSQYFLLTPKLLPDLEYVDNMTVLCVFNGPSMVNHTEWNLKKYLRRRRKLVDE